MADLSDVENALVSAVAQGLFPAGGYQPGSLAASAASWPPVGNAAGAAAPGSVKLYRGWPESSLLDADLVAGNSHVSVFPETGMSRLTTRYEDQWKTASPVTPTLTVSVSGSTVTFGGSGGSGQVAGVLVGAGATPSSFAYRVLTTDTPTSVASAFAAMIAGSTVNGPALTVPSSSVQALVGADQTAWLETRRQIKSFRVDVWCPTPAARDAVASLVDSTMAQFRWLALADGSAGRLLFVSDATEDKSSKDRVWRRWMRYSVEYPTTLIQVQPEMLFGIENVTPNGTGTTFQFIV